MNGHTQVSCLFTMKPVTVLVVLNVTVNFYFFVYCVSLFYEALALISYGKGTNSIFSQPDISFWKIDNHLEILVLTSPVEFFSKYWSKEALPCYLVESIFWNWIHETVAKMELTNVKSTHDIVIELSNTQISNGKSFLDWEISQFILGVWRSRSYFAWFPLIANNKFRLLMNIL